MPEPVDPPVVDPPADLEPPTDPPVDDVFDKERAMATIRTLREAEKAGKQSAKELLDARTRLAEIEAAQLTEQERVTKERDDLKTRATSLEATNKENVVKLAVFSLQTTMGLADAEMTLAMLDRAKIEWGDDGEPSNIGDLLTALLEAKPLLKSAPPPPKAANVNAGAGGTSGPPPDLTAEELRMAEQTGHSPERVALWKRVMAGEVSAMDAVRQVTAPPKT